MYLVMILVLVVTVGSGDQPQEMKKKTWSPVAEASKGAVNIAIVVLGGWYCYLREQFKGA